MEAGSDNPIKVTLADAAGRPISDTSAAALLTTPGKVNLSAAGAQTVAPQCMKSDAANDQFVYAWALQKKGSATGATTIMVTVSYPGTNRVTSLTTNVRITS